MLDIFPSLSKTKTLILMLLHREGELFGLQLVEKSHGRLKRGTVYVVLQQMADADLVAGRTEERTPPEIGIPRKMYRLTETGKRLARALAAAQKVMEGSR